MSGLYGGDLRQEFIEKINIPLIKKPFTVVQLLNFISSNKNTRVTLKSDAVCEFIEKCEFFNNVDILSDTMIKAWKSMFCLNLKKSNRCKRKQFVLQTGNKPDKDLTPTGIKMK